MSTAWPGCWCWRTGRIVSCSITSRYGRTGRDGVSGRVLLDFAEAEARRCGWDAVTLYTNALMTQNIAIYTARGYVETERRTEQGFQRVYMEKPLA